MARTQIPGPRRTARAAAVLAAAALLLIGLPAGASPTVPNVGSMTDDQDGTVRVVIEMDVARTPDWLIGPLSAVHKQAAIASANTEVTAQVESRGGKVVRDFAVLPYVVGRVAPAQIATLRLSPDVVAIQEEQAVTSLLDDSIPLVGAGPGAPEIAGVHLTGEGQTVAIIDTGIEADHEFFGGVDASRVVAESCFTENACPDGGSMQQGAGAAAPLGFHGTHVGGIAAGNRSGSDPSRGLASAADLIAIQVFQDVDSVDDEGIVVTERVAYPSDIAASLVWLKDWADTSETANLAAVNLSLGGGSYTGLCDGNTTWGPTFDAVENLRDAGVVTVAASGNAGSRSAMTAPACLSNVISVGATHEDQISPFTNLSRETDLVAPGGGEPGQLITSSGLNDSYRGARGTSMAAPHVAGAIALLRQVHAGETPDMIIGRLLDSNITVSDERDGGAQTGLPRLDLPAALNLPGAPTMSTAEPLDGAAHVTWEVPTHGNGSEIGDYAVEYASDGNTWTRSPSVGPSTDLEGTVDGLTNGDSYTFRVRAISGTDSSPTSRPSDPVTVGVPRRSATPTAVAMDRSAEVTWVAPHDNGSAINGYRVDYAKDGDDHWSELLADGNKSSLTIDGLEANATYRFRVSAENARGVGESSEPSPGITPFAPPGAPTGLKAQGRHERVELAWESPAETNGSPIDGYVVQTSADGGTTWSGTFTESNDPDFTVIGLANGSSYEFRVAATNEAGTGDYSDAVIASPAVTLPGQPTEVTASAGDATVTITWQPPVDPGDPELTSYLATESSDSAAGCTLTELMGELACSFESLENGREYTFSVVAANALGDEGQPFDVNATPAAPPSNGGGGGGGLAAGGGGGGGLPPAEEGDGAGDDDQPAPATDPDGSLPSQDPGTSTLLLDGQETQADVIVAGSTVTVSGPDLSLTLSASTPAGVAEDPDGDAWPQLTPGGQLGVAFGGLLGGSSAHGWLFSEPVLLGSATASAAGNIDAAWTVPTTIAGGAHTLQVNGTLADGRSITFNLGIDVEAAISFPDVDPDATHGQAILRLAQLGIVTGFSDGTFGPALPVNRGQMASFLQRALELEPGESGAFPDTAGGTHDLAISAIAAADIATGFEDGTYRPGEPVTRGQMATFLANAVELVETPDGPFIDIDGNVHAGRINAVAAAGIAEGFDDDTYRPGLDITRAQMASLISRMLDHLAQAA